MYTTSSIAPVFIVHTLAHSGLLKSGSKIVLVSSESGSITLRHESEGGGNYAHHASKAALNMVGKLLSLDLKEKGVIVSIVHPGFMRTEMTQGVGFDKYWDDGGGEFVSQLSIATNSTYNTGTDEYTAVTPDESAKSLIDWTEKLDMTKSGEYWAPRGPGKRPQRITNAIC
jgi:NAD(P)-dependent dehydrogenase (short-subunit alcohol dehydrogenase family)